MFGGLGSDQKVLQMGIQLCLFSLAEFLFCELGKDNVVSTESDTLGSRKAYMMETPPSITLAAWAG